MARRGRGNDEAQYARRVVPGSMRSIGNAPPPTGVQSEVSARGTVHVNGHASNPAGNGGSPPAARARYARTYTSVTANGPLVVHRDVTRFAPRRTSR